MIAKDLSPFSVVVEETHVSFVYSGNIERTFLLVSSINEPPRATVHVRVDEEDLLLFPDESLLVSGKKIDMNTLGIASGLNPPGAKATIVAQLIIFE